MPYSVPSLSAAAPRRHGQGRQRQATDDAADQLAQWLAAQPKTAVRSAG